MIAARKNWRFWVIAAHDLLILTLSFPLAIIIRHLDDSSGIERFWLATLQSVALSLLLGIGVFGGLGVWRGFWRYTSPEQLLAVIKATTCVVLLLCFSLFALGQLSMVPRSIPFIQWMLIVVVLVGSRLVYATTLAPWRARRQTIPAANWEPVLLLGFGEGAALLIQMLRARSMPSIEAVGILDDRPGHVGRALFEVPVLGGTTEMEAIVARLEMRGIRPKRLVLTHGSEGVSGDALDRLYDTAERLDLEICSLSALIRLKDSAVSSAVMVPKLGHRTAQHLSQWVKRILDIAVALLALAFGLPLLGLIALAIGLELGRPIIFDQVRPGRGLGNFTLYKFRTLHDLVAADGRPLPDEARASRIGGWLRRSRLDELPQLWNVLMGDMSLIGPRPLLPRDLPALGEARHERFLVRPGITGWAQVNGGHQLTTPEKLALDLWYIRHWSPWLDLRILAKTFWMMARGEKIDRTALEQAAG